LPSFNPDYHHIIDAAYNVQSKRLPLYEHLINISFMEKMLNKRFADLQMGNQSDKQEFYRIYNNFFKTMGYDTVSFECCITDVVQGGDALKGLIPGIIKNRDDFRIFPFDELPDIYYDKFHNDFRIVRETLPEGMKVTGGVGSGIFEIMQDFLNYASLCYISKDDPGLYSDMYTKVGDITFLIWEKILKEFNDIIAVCRFGDDLGYKTSTLLSQEDIKKHIIPHYKRIIDLIHSYNKPFLFHSCGDIFVVMDDLIETAGIDAKHSNEDEIAPFSEWIKRYGDRIGNFGGVDLGFLCTRNEKEIKEYSLDLIEYSIGSGGFAFGSGNSIPDYVPVKNYLAMIETVREFRGDFYRKT